MTLTWTESHAANDLLTASVYRLQVTVSDYWYTFGNTSSATRATSLYSAQFQPWFSVYCILPRVAAVSIVWANQRTEFKNPVIWLDVGWHCSCSSMQYSLHSKNGEWAWNEVCWDKAWDWAKENTGNEAAASTLTMRAVRLILNTAGASGRNVNCWKSVDWMKALACTHFACSTVTFRPLLLTKQVAICSENK